MKIQQHDGVVVDAAGSRQGFAKRKRGGEVLRRKREAPRARDAAAIPPPSLYRGLGGAGPRRWDLLGGGGQGRNPSSPRHLGGAFPLWDSSLLEP